MDTCIISSVCIELYHLTSKQKITAKYFKVSFDNDMIEIMIKTKVCFVNFFQLIIGNGYFTMQL